MNRVEIMNVSGTAKWTIIVLLERSHPHTQVSLTALLWSCSCSDNPGVSCNRWTFPTFELLTALRKESGVAVAIEQEDPTTNDKPRFNKPRFDH
jgi:hypothetical protein